MHAKLPDERKKVRKEVVISRVDREVGASGFHLSYGHFAGLRQEVSVAARTICTLTVSISPRRPRTSSTALA